MKPPVAAAAILAAAVAGCAAGPSAAEGGVTVVVAFGSEAMGIDGAAYQAVARLAETSPLVKTHSERAWGREGERTVTLVAGDAASARRLLAAVRAALPAKLARGYVDITGPGGEAIHIGR